MIQNWCHIMMVITTCIYLPSKDNMPHKQRGRDRAMWFMDLANIVMKIKEGAFFSNHFLFSNSHTVFTMCMRIRRASESNKTFSSFLSCGGTFLVSYLLDRYFGLMEGLETLRKYYTQARRSTQYTKFWKRIIVLNECLTGEDMYTTK